jgi:Terminase RNaseH-like domain/Terminase large subunit, T4likevirus-type, N-terminal
MTIDDAAHFTPEQRQEIIASYPVHERDARTRGIPSLGSGLVFPVSEEQITCDPIPIPKHWYRINGLDFGYEHPFAACSLAWDKDTDIIYVAAVYRQKHATPLVHAAAIKPWGAWIPCAWPHDGLQHDKGSGEGLAAQYAAHGLNMLPERATFEDGGSGVEAGVIEMLDRLQTGRLKIFRHLEAWLDERRTYHRKDGMIVKERDDLISATRYAVMMKRFAALEPTKHKRPRPHPGAAPGAWMGI